MSASRKHKQESGRGDNVLVTSFTGDVHGVAIFRVQNRPSKELQVILNGASLEKSSSLVESCWV